METFSESTDEPRSTVLAETEEYIDLEWSPTTTIREVPEAQLSQYCFDPSFQPIPYRNASTVLKFKFNCIDSSPTDETYDFEASSIMLYYADGILTEIWSDDTRIWIFRNQDVDDSNNST